MTVTDAWKPRPHAYLLISLVAVVAWGAAFLAPESLYWDDWVSVNDDTIRSARELGLPWTGYIFVALFALGAWSFKVVAIGATIVVGCAVHAIAGRGLGLNPQERLLLATLVVALPLASTRMIAVLVTYSWSAAFFFVAWYLLVSDGPVRSRTSRDAVATLLLFGSYTTGSLLPFTVLPILHLAHLRIRRDVPVWAGALRFAARFWFVFAAPVVFWIVRTLFLQPSGVYADYNTVRLAGGMSNPITADILRLSAALIFVVLTFASWLPADHSRIGRMRRGLCLAALAVTTGAMGVHLLTTRASAESTALVIPVALLLCAATLLGAAIHRLTQRRGPADVLSAEARAGDPTPLLATGLVALILALLPYLLVSKPPTFAQWETRHQLLMPLGIAIIVVAAVRALAAITRRSVVRVVSLGLVAVFACTSLIVSLKLVADWRKQVQVTQALAAEPLVRDAGVVVFADESAALNYDARWFRFYEYNGWLSRAFGDQSRLGIDQRAVASFRAGAFDRLSYAASRYGFGDYEDSSDGVLVQIVAADEASWWTLLRDEPSISLRVTPIEDWDALTP